MEMQVFFGNISFQNISHVLHVTEKYIWYKLLVRMGINFILLNLTNSS
jgi:hypothetical protein